MASMKVTLPVNYAYLLHARSASMKRYPPHDAPWRAAAAAERRHPHIPTPMRSGCSKPPTPMWICDLCCVTERTLDLTPPICTGGFSRSTHYIEEDDVIALRFGLRRSTATGEYFLEVVDSSSGRT
jgi:hypothetical protein